MTAPNGWPGAPGYPAQADQDSAGHVLRVDGRVDVYSWKAFHQWFEDRKGRWVAPVDLVEDGDDYLGQILTPAEVAAREAAAREEGRLNATLDAPTQPIETARVHGGPALSDLFAVYRLDVDLMICRRCRRRQEVSWQDHPFPHAIDCFQRHAEPHPWRHLSWIVTNARRSGEPLTCQPLPAPPKDDEA